MRRLVTILWAAATILFLPSLARAHEEGAPFSDAIVDPLVVHHAHIENEERINFFALNGVRDVQVPGRAGYKSELELAYGLPSHRYGFEVFIPVANLPAPEGNGRVTGLGDILLRPIKVALFMQPDFILSTASEFRMPTGNQRKGLGTGAVGFEQLLFVDLALGNWNVAVNLGLGSYLSGASAVPLVYGTVLAYSFISDTRIGRTAQVPHAQAWVPSISLEFLGEHLLQPVAMARDSNSGIPGLTLWHVPTGWQFRAGIEVPTFGKPEATSVILLQVGNHVKWLGPA